MFDSQAYSSDSGLKTQTQRACLLLHWGAVRVSVDSSSPELLSVNSHVLLDRRERKGRRRERQRRTRQGKEKTQEGRKEGRKESPPSPLESWHRDTHWLNRIRERTMNLKMYSKAFMALYSWSLIPGFSALST